MRRHATGSIATHTASLALACGCLVLLAFASSASAATTQVWRHAFDFNGSDTTAGAFGSPERVAVDSQSGAVYVMDNGNDVIAKFNADGEASNFAATGTSSLDGSGTPDGVFGLGSAGGGGIDNDIAVDNSGGATQGRLYLTKLIGPTWAFDPEGSYLWQLPASLFGENCGVAVDSEGHLWVGDYTRRQAIKFAKTGSPPAELSTVDDTSGNHCRLNVDGSGAVYLNQYGGPVNKYVGGVFQSQLDSGSNVAVAIDQFDPDGHVFTIQAGAFHEYDATGMPLRSGGEGEIANGRGIAYNSSLGRVYVADTGSGTIKVYDLLTATTPDIAMDPVTDVSETTALFTGTVNAQGVENSWRFQWKKASQSWEEAESSPAQGVPADTDSHAVSHEATSLEPKTVYDVRLVAANTDLGVSGPPVERQFNTSPPIVFAEPVAPRLDTSVRLNARVNPGGNSTAVRFEYSQDGSNWSTAEEQAGAGAETIVVGTEVGGLTPDTEYRFRVSVASVVGSADGGELFFKTRTTEEVTLPKRGIELVNNPSKGNQHVNRLSVFRTRPAPSSDRAFWSVNAGAPGATVGTGAVFLAKRTAAGWASESMIPSADQQIGGGNLSFSPLTASADGSRVLFQTGEGVLANPDVHLVRSSSGQQELLYTRSSAQEEAVRGSVDTSEDLEHVVLPDPNDKQLIDVGDGTPEMLSLMPDGSPSCGVGYEQFFYSIYNREYHWVSADGSRVFFQSKAGDCGPDEPERLWLRNRDEGTTEEVIPSGEFIRASRDGDTALVYTAAGLAGEDTNGNPDLYLWQAGGAAQCVTCVVPDADVIYPGPLVSEDLSRVYFISAKQLTPDGEPGGTYVVQAGEIASVPVNLNDEVLATADATVLVFMGTPEDRLTSDEIASECPNRTGTGEITIVPCRELYRYDATDQSVECVSCRRGGVTTGLVSGIEVGARLSDDGSTVAFTSEGPLVRDDVNGQADVYEWRNGVISMITDGETKRVFGFGYPVINEVDATGDNLFFTAAGVSTGFEQDGLASLYDARVGGGFIPPNPETHCVEDSCQGPLQAAPALARSASAGFSGQGNSEATSARRRCKAGQARRRGRCVAKRKAKRRSGAQKQRSGKGDGGRSK